MYSGNATRCENAAGWNLKADNLELREGPGSAGFLVNVEEERTIQQVHTDALWLVSSANSLHRM
jgi:hypothetical protein